MPAGGLEGLQGAQEVPALAGLCRRHTEELEELLPSQVSGSYNNSNNLERIQGEEALLQNAHGSDTVASDWQRIPITTQVSERVESVGFFWWTFKQ